MRHPRAHLSPLKKSCAPPRRAAEERDELAPFHMDPPTRLKITRKNTTNSAGPYLLANRQLGGRGRYRLSDHACTAQSDGGWSAVLRALPTQWENFHLIEA
jgi:hypothetical protein